jgi:hypothetical protein
MTDFEISVTTVAFLIFLGILTNVFGQDKD